jgi:hypothetical protein
MKNEKQRNEKGNTEWRITSVQCRSVNTGYIKMKKILLLNIVLLFLSGIKAQINYPYEEAIARAALFHLQKKHKEAILQYEKAFQFQQPDSLNAYKAAGVYSLDSNIEKAYYYIKEALLEGWREADMLATDPYFEYMRKAAPKKWDTIIELAYIQEKIYDKQLHYPGLRYSINNRTLKDQRLRYARIQANSKEEKNRIDREIYLSDSANRINAKAILKQYGWPKISDIGNDGQNNFWLLVQHADDDVLLQRTALADMEKLLKTKEINLENYAFLYDRVQCNLNYKQLYGTQVNWKGHGEATGFRGIIQEDKVDERRKALGLLPLKIYALTYGFEYNNISSAAAKENDSADVVKTRSLIDSAKYFYTRKEYQKVYDLYNSASLILGGMSNTDNFEAAILFAKIAGKDNNPQYKFISLDFLNLLYLRGGLSKGKLQSQPAFKILRGEPRWIEIYDHL